MEHLPERTGQIFEALTSSKSGFLCENSTDREIQKLYNVLDEHFDVLSEYFAKIGFLLKRGNGYAYFSKDLKRTELEERLQRAFKWIDIVDFFKSYDSSFSAYSTFRVADIVQRCMLDLALKQKLQELKRHLRHPKENLTEIAGGIVAQLEYQFVELEDEDERRYKVLSSFRYLEDLFARIAEEEPYEDAESDLLHQ